MIDGYVAATGVGAIGRISANSDAEGTPVLLKRTLSSRGHVVVRTTYVENKADAPDVVSRVAK
jgi:hypothetical protein